MTPKGKAALIALAVVIVVSGLALLHQTDAKFSVMIPAEGGVLKEGIIGTPRFINPILAISDADRDMAALVYSGLMKIGKSGGLIPDLAEKYETSKDGLCYTFTLKKDLKWSDNKPLTTGDVIFTIDQMKKDYLTKNPKRASWEGVEVEKTDDRVIKFCLTKPYAPFLENTTMGILPEHIWQDILPEQMPLSDFNIKPIGSGPYKIGEVSRNSSGIITSYTLKSNKYYASGKPKIKTLTLRFYPSEKKLLEAYKKGEITSLSALSSKSMLEIKKTDSVLKTFLLPRAFGAFFNQANAPIFAEKEVRKALDLAVDREKIVKEVLQNFGTILIYPIPPGSFGALTGDAPLPAEENFKKAQETLQKNGWKLNEDGVFEKKKSSKETIKLEFSLATSNLSDLTQTAELLKEMWEKLGAKVNVKIYELGDLEQNVIRTRKYDVLLFGEVLGRDPDPFAFWHSSQRNDPGLNIASYTNISTDKLLEDARITLDDNKRKEKYEQFQKKIEKDTAAIFLYSPEFLYLVPSSIKGVPETSVVIPSERFSNINEWYINTKKIWNIFK